MTEMAEVIDRKAILTLRRQVRFQDGRPDDARCSKVAAALEAQFGWPRKSGRLRLLIGRVCWLHCWNQLADGRILDAVRDSVEEHDAAMPCASWMAAARQVLTIMTGWSLPDDIVDYVARALRVRSWLRQSMTSGQLDDLLTMYEWAHATAARGGPWMSSEYAAVLE